MSFLYLGNKDFKAIQQIVKSTKTVNLTKRVQGQTAYLAIMIKKKKSDRYKPCTKPNKKCFNYGRNEHYRKDCQLISKENPKDEKVME